jgi:hypothetical protein
MAQIPIANSLASANQATNQTTNFATCAVGWGRSRNTVPNNASFGDPWGDYPLDFGTPKTSIDEWDDLTNVDRHSIQPEMWNHEYKIPFSEDNGSSPPWMIK